MSGTALLLAVATGVALPGKDEKNQSLPPAVAETVSRLAPRARVLKLEKERDAAGVVWEVKFESSAELKVREDGSLVKYEHSIPVSLLPKAVTNSAAVRGKEILGAEVILANGDVGFEVLISGPSGKRKVTLSASGKSFGK